MLILALFLAAALIVPAGDETPRKAFERDGRWAMALLAGCHLIEIVVNTLVFGERLVSAGQATLVVQSALALAVALTRSRRAQEMATVDCVAATVVDLTIDSRFSYG